MRTSLRLGLVLSAVVACSSGNDDASPRYTTEVLTRHDRTGYSGVLTVHDGACALSAVTVTGIGITGSAPLTHATNRCDEWKLEVSYGSTAPSSPPSYTLTIAQGGQLHDEPLVAACPGSTTGFHETFALPVWPGSPLTSPITLNWSAVGPGSDYLVALDLSGSPPTENPSLATSPVLTNSTTYQLGIGGVLPVTSGGFRVFAGPAGWTTHTASSCYSVSEATGPFVVVQ